MSNQNAKSMRTRGTCGNLLIDALPARERRSVIASCSTVELAQSRVLSKAGKAYRYIYFPLSGSIAVTQEVDANEPLELRSIGAEGMLGASVVLGINRALQGAVVQLPCSAMRISSGPLRSLLEECPGLRRGLQRYLYFVLSDLSQTAACMRYHGVRPRLVRALLMVHDRVARDDLPLMTHSMLAKMLGVQRGSVTLAAADLQRAGYLRYQRGKISILDRPRLETEACDCYRVRLDNYRRSLAR
jgi:CRP-like cAMP-binding protein